VHKFSSRVCVCTGLSLKSDRMVNAPFYFFFFFNCVLNFALYLHACGPMKYCIVYLKYCHITALIYFWVQPRMLCSTFLVEKTPAGMLGGGVRHCLQESEVECRFHSQVDGTTYNTVCLGQIQSKSCSNIFLHIEDFIIMYGLRDQGRQMVVLAPCCEDASSMWLTMLVLFRASP